MSEFRKIAGMRKRFLVNVIRHRKQGDALKFLVITAFIAGFWFLTYFLFNRAFIFLDNFPGIGDLIRDRLIYVVFGIVFLMLLISTAVLSFSKLYLSRETKFLLTLPVAPSTVFSFKSLESVLISSWASVFMMSPLLAAYGRQYSHHWLYYFGSALMYFPFVLIAGVLGILLAWLSVRYFNLNSFRKTGAVLLAAGSAGLVLYFNFAAGAVYHGETTAAINRLMGHTNVFLFPFLPSFWMGEGLLSMSLPDLRQAGVYSGLLVSTALVTVTAIQRTGRKHYLPCWFSVQDRTYGGKSPVSSMVDRIIPLFSFLPASRAAFIVKDLKTFLRDPQQWTQAFLFSGLLLIYIFNLRRMPVDIESFYWRRLVYFLNMSAIITILSMTSVRFAFPAISMEGKRFWITLLSPVRLNRLVLEKFYLAGAMLSALGIVLVISINYVLKTGAAAYIVSSAFIILVGFTLSGLAVGIGALFPDFKEESISKISSGFGATLTLIVSLAYMMLVIAAVAVPVFNRKPLEELPLLAPVGAMVIAVSLLCILVPVRLGIKHLNNSDF